jgi:hypothetical protein
VVKCTAAGAFSIGGLPTGTYGIKYTTPGAFDVDLPDQTLSWGQAVTAAIPQAGVLTVYGKPSPSDRQTPSVPTNLAVKDAAPARIVLTWNAATDDVGVAGYKIYRDGIRIGFSPTPAFDDLNVQAGASYADEVGAYDAAGNESPRSTALGVTVPPPLVNTDLLASWKFDEGQGVVAVDSSAYGHDARIFGATWGSGKIGQALVFDGGNDYVQASPSPSLDNLQGLTIAAWIYPRIDAHWHVLDKGDGDKRLLSEGLSRTLDGRIRYTGAHAYSHSASNIVRLSEWQHVAMTWSGTAHVVRLYHNGVEVPYATQDVGAGVPQGDADYPFTIGARGALGSDIFFHGLIDELRLYNRPLTDQEVHALHAGSASQR